MGARLRSTCAPYSLPSALRHPPSPQPRPAPAHHTSMRTPVLATLIAIIPPSLTAQSLGAPVAIWQQDFSRIGGVAELPDGRVVIVDNLDELVFVGAATGGGVTQLGRQGDGPDEYRRPWSPVRGPGDTILVHAQNRLVRVTPAGVIAGSHPFASRALGGGVGPPRGVDIRGRVYWDRPVIRDPQSNAIKRQQQFEIVRLLLGSETVEVVATASDHAPEQHDERFHPFAQRDEWVPDPDGSIRIVRARDYSVDVVRDRRVVRTAAAIPFDPARITTSDREDYRYARAANAPSVSFGGRSAATGSGVTPERLAQMREAYPDEMFPTHKPPFIEGGTFRSPGGHLWVTRSPDAGESRPRRVDVIDETGRRIREIDLPAGRRLLGLDRRGVYLVREDDDGMQRLERYAWPEGLR